MSAEIQESMTNLKVIVAFNRLDYFRQKFNEANERNFAASLAGGFCQRNIYAGLWAGTERGAVSSSFLRKIDLIGAGQLTVGLLIGFLLYVNSFYMPLRQVANVVVASTCLGGARSDFRGSRASVEHAGCGFE